MILKRRSRQAAILILGLALLGLRSPIPAARAETSASLYVGPNTGTFVVDSVFTVSVYVNTNGQDINALDAILKFPPDKLQVVSPTAGKSFLQIWVTPPVYDNSAGTIRFQGAIPNPGINTSQGLISQVTFRVINIGSANIRFDDSSKVLLNDGKGTNILGRTSSGLYKFILPPPAGPVVTSETNPDPERWYNSKTAVFRWQGDPGVDGYSFVLDDEPDTIPDDIVESTSTTQTYRDVADGMHYFHIKAHAAGVWDGTTHYLIKVDTTPPADFSIQVSPSSFTTTKQPTVTFQTTDAESGVDHYELRLVPLVPSGSGGSNPQSFFVETTSPYIPDLDYGAYDVIVRAYDKAGNYAQSTERIQIVTSIFSVVRGQGIQVKSNVLVPWFFVWIFVIVLLLFAGWFAWRAWRRHRATHVALSQAPPLPPAIKAQLEELKVLKDKYKIIIKVIFLVVALTSALVGGRAARADMVELGAPQVSTYPAGLSNTEIFYAGGKSEAPGSQIILYLQNLQNSETFSMTVPVDKNGEWFYTHPTFLSAGKYVVWAQDKLGSIMSPPSPQVSFTVTETAVQFGASRLSYEIIYLIAAILLLLVILGLFAFGMYHHRAEKRKRAKIHAELRETEAVVKEGFASLVRDLQNHINHLGRLKMTRTLSDEEKALEQKIKKDLEGIRSSLGRELWTLNREVDDIS
ncbi:MAG TPA: cohesin domain-containing protein [Candidatus Paceibacterota bacterium]|nr:cohesin domain-containing protein [Candidatus Paceibacterota bacterium]